MAVSGRMDVSRIKNMKFVSGSLLAMALLLLYADYIQNVLQWMNRIDHEGYYVKMAVAWALSVCYVKFPKETMLLLKENRLDDFTYNKALQKNNRIFSGKSGR